MNVFVLKLFYDDLMIRKRDLYDLKHRPNLMIKKNLDFETNHLFFR